MSQRRTVRWIGWGLLGIVTLMVLLPFVARRWPGRGAPTALLFGWFHVLKDNLPRVTVNWGLIATGVVCSILILVIGNPVLRALSNQFWHPTAQHANAFVWRWRCTLCLFAGILLLFVVAFGSAGLFRHTQWLLDYDESWFQVRGGALLDFREADMVLQTLLLEHERDPMAAYGEFNVERWRNHEGRVMADAFEVLLYYKTNQAPAYLIIPRESRLAAQGRFWASIPGSDQRYRPMSELPRTIAELDAAYSTPNPR